MVGNQNENIINEKINEEHIEKEKNSTKKVLKIFSVILGIFTIISLIIIKVNNASFPLFWIIAIAVVVLIICVIIFFFFSIFKKSDDIPEEKTRNGLAKSAALSDLRVVAEGALVNRHFCNHLKKCEEERFFHAGKNKERIYIYKARALYDTGMSEGYVYIIINTHDTELRTILIDPSIPELIKAINSITCEPSDDPDVYESKVYNPISGTYVENREVKKHAEAKKEEVKKEDL